MTVLPVVTREMAVMARRKSMYWSRWVTAILALIVMLWLLIVSASQLSFSGLGRSVFLILSSLCFVFTALVGVQATADCLSEEKREGTLGLLFLTDLKSFDLVAGKLAASSLHAVLVLIGIIPMLSLSLLLGGVSLLQFGRAALVLFNTLFLSLALGVVISSISNNERKAMMGTFACVLMYFFGPFLVGIAFGDRLRFSEELIAISPIYSFSAVHQGPVSYFWQSLAGNHLVAWGLLILSAWIVPRSLNAVPSRALQRLRALNDAFVYGRREERKKHRATLLDRNAFLWLASRERVKPKYAWGVVAFFIALYAWVIIQFEGIAFELPVCIAIVLLVHCVFKIWVASEVCSRLIQDRRSGALELLLSSPLSVRNIAEGQALALRRIFSKPILLLLLLEMVLVTLCLNTRQTVASEAVQLTVWCAVIGTFLVDLWALKWVGLWLSLTGKSIERVLLVTLLRVLVLPWFVYLLIAGFVGARLLFFSMDGSDAAAAVFGWGLGGIIAVLISAILGFSARHQFLRRFRELAAKRFDSPLESEATAPEPSEPDWRSRKDRLIDLFMRRPVANSALITFLLVVVFIWGRAQYWNRSVELEIRAARQAGFPMSMSESASYHPAPERAENAFAILDDFGPFVPQFAATVPRKLRINGRDATQEEIHNYARERASEFYANNQPLVEALWRLPEFERAYIDPIGNNLWALQTKLVGYAHILAGDLALSSHPSAEIEPLRARKNIRAMIALARLLRQQPLVFAHHSSGEVLRQLGAGLGDVFARDMLTDEVLTDLQRELDGIEQSDTLVRAIVLQRAYFVEPPPNQLRMMGVVNTGGNAAVLIERMMTIGGSGDKAFAGMLGSYIEGLNVAEQPYPQRADGLRKFNSLGYGSTRQSLANMPSPFGYLPDAFMADASFTANWHLVRILFAIERFQRKHGNSPETLSTLVPEFLPTLPLDPYSGEPFRLKRRGEDLMIYSVGLDRSDDTAEEKKGRSGTDMVFIFR